MILVPQAAQRDSANTAVMLPPARLGQGVRVAADRCLWEGSDTTMIAANRPKDVDSVLLRLPAGLREKVATAAKTVNVSQNALITASVLLSTVAWGECPTIGRWENVRVLMTEIDKAAASEDGVVLGAFSRPDWDDVEPFISAFDTYDLVESLRVRQDAAASDTIVYSFSLSRLGKSVLPLITFPLEIAIERVKRTAPAGPLFDIPNGAQTPS